MYHRYIDIDKVCFFHVPIDLLGFFCRDYNAVHNVSGLIHFLHLVLPPSVGYKIVTLQVFLYLSVLVKDFV
jgi:hypothetical protein